VSTRISQSTAVGPALYDTRLPGTVVAKPRQRPATLVLLRGVAKGEPTACLAREWGLSRQQRHTLRQRIHANINGTAPTNVMGGTAFEADERYQNAGPNSTPHHDPTAAHADAPINARGTASLPTTVPQSSAASRGTQVSSACGSATMPTRKPAPL
jgi:hypothetical protein